MKRKPWLFITQGAITVFEFFITKTAFAQNTQVPPPTGGGGLSLPNPLGQNCTNLQCPLNAVINFAYTISLPLCAIIVLYAGFQMATAGGDPEKFSTGRKTLLYAAAGFIVILLAKGAAASIQAFLGPGQ